MYDEHYGLTGRPFQLTPDPRFWFDTATHKKAMAYLGYGLSQGEGFIVITGDIGAGKTTLVGHLVDTIDPERLNVIRIVSTQIAADDLLRTVCAGLGIEATGMAKAQMLSSIERGLHAIARGGRRTLLIVDEAQALPVDSLEELRMLSNFQAGGHALLQIFLLGQPEFREKLSGDGLEQLRQRVIAMHHLGPMEADELEPYLIHRLTVVGWDGRPRFKTDALATIYAWSGGIPRRINSLVSRVLLHGAIEGIDVFTGADVQTVVGDLDTDGMTGGAIGHIAVAADEPAPVAEEGLAEVAEAPPVETAAPMEWPFTPAPAPVTPEPSEWRPIVNSDAAPEPVAAARPITVEAPSEPAPDPVAEPDPAPVAEIAPEAASAPVRDTQPVAIAAPPRLFDPIRLSGRRSVLAPVDALPEPAPFTPEPPAPVAVAESEPIVLEPPVSIAIEPGLDPAPIVLEPPVPVAAAPEPIADAEATAVPVIDLDIARRLADMDRRLEEQDVALRRVLTLLVDWVEGGGARPDLSELRDRAG